MPQESQIGILIIHYNNSDAIIQTILNLLNCGIGPHCITIFDNYSNVSHRAKLEEISKDLDTRLVLSEENVGWGKAINTYLDSKDWTDDQILGVTAHDTRMYGFREDILVEAFKDPSVLVAVPEYKANPVDITYRVERGFRAQARKPRVSQVSRPIEIGQATFNFIRPMRIKQLRYDENFFIYGCESEIFLRIKDLGLKVTSIEDIKIENCTTDSSSRYRVLAFTINSLYLAKQRLGIFGYCLRALVVASSIILAAIKFDWLLFSLKLSALTHSIILGGKGFACYLKNRKNTGLF